MRAQSMSEHVPAYTSRNLVGLSPGVSSQLSRTAIPFILRGIGKKVCLLCTVSSFQFGRRNLEGTALEMQRPEEVDGEDRKKVWVRRWTEPRLG